MAKRGKQASTHSSSDSRTKESGEGIEEDDVKDIRKLFEIHNKTVVENRTSGRETFLILKEALQYMTDEYDELLELYLKTTAVSEFCDIRGALECLKDAIWDMDEVEKGVISKMKKCLSTQISPVKVGDYRVTMINSNFCLGFGIEPYKLYNILAKEMGVYVSYDPDKYDAVKISFMYNENKKVQNGVCECKDNGVGKVCSCKNFKDNGVCDCYSFCKVAKKFKKTNNCKVITISVFDNKGNVVITGSKDFNHSMAAYKFINTVAKVKYSDIVSYSITQFEDELKNGILETKGIKVYKIDNVLVDIKESTDRGSEEMDMEEIGKKVKIRVKESS